MREDKEKCYLSLDWDRVWNDYCVKMHIDRSSMSLSYAEALVSYVEQEINRICEKLVHDKMIFDTEQVRLDFIKGYKDKIHCIRELRRIGIDTSLKEAKEIVELWDK